MMKATKEQVLMAVPTECPVCKHPTILSADYAHLECSNSACEGKFSRKLEIFAKALDMEYFGPSNCILLANIISRFSELFSLSIDNMIEAGISPGIAKHLFSNINKVEKVKLDKFLTALGIPKCGPVIAKEVAVAFKSYEAVFTATELDLMFSVESLAEASAANLAAGLRDIKEEADELRKHFEVVAMDAKGFVEQPFLGMLICITGPLSIERDVWKLKIEEGGGKFVSSVSKNTTCLICNKKSSSSKYTKAESLGVPIYTEAWLIEKMS